jgi:hypothetical protein
MKRVIGALIVCAAAMVPTTGSALADNVHLATGVGGQPDAGGTIVNCGAPLNGNGVVLATSTGNSNPTNAGSPFTSNPNGSISGSVYAGSAPQNSNNPNSISQYDVACFQATMH